MISVWLFKVAICHWFYPWGWHVDKQWEKDKQDTSELCFEVGMRVRSKIMRTLSEHSNFEGEGVGDTACMAFSPLLVWCASPQFFCLLGACALNGRFLYRVFTWSSWSNGQEHFVKADMLYNFKVLLLCFCKKDWKKGGYPLKTVSW